MRSSVDVDKLGEQALKETKDERDMISRLEQIEKDLASLSIHSDLEVNTVEPRSTTTSVMHPPHHDDQISRPEWFPL
jgi:hypothetical protein